MCLILTGSHPRYPLVVAANRDEFRDRPAAKLSLWDGEAGVALYAGRDLRAGGTWMAVDRRGAFAAITNFREASPVIGGRSRGLVPGQVLAAPTLEAGVRAFFAERDQYGGMHVLAGDRGGFWHASNRGAPEDQAPERWAPGSYALCNGRRRDLWPKMRRGAAGVRAILAGLGEGREDGRAREDGLIDALMALLSEAGEAPESELPQTGVSREWERALSAICVDPGFTGPYGVRCSTVLLVGEGRARLVEWTRDGRTAGWREGSVVEIEIEVV